MTSRPSFQSGLSPRLWQHYWSWHWFICSRLPPLSPSLLRLDAGPWQFGLSIIYPWTLTNSPYLRWFPIWLFLPFPPLRPRFKLLSSAAWAMVRSLCLPAFHLALFAIAGKSWEAPDLGLKRCPRLRRADPGPRWCCFHDLGYWNKALFALCLYLK